MTRDFKDVDSESRVLKVAHVEGDGSDEDRRMSLQTQSLMIVEDAPLIDSHDRCLRRTYWNSWEIGIDVDLGTHPKLSWRCILL